jgi:hypothetical protein
MVRVQVNLFEGIATENQRLASETLAAIQNNPASLALAVDIMNDPDILTAPDLLWISRELPTATCRLRLTKYD